MIRESAVSALDGLVGFRQPLDTSYPTLDAGNIASSSGLYFEGASNIVKVTTIIDCFEYPEMTAAQANTELDNLRNDAARDLLNRIFSDKSVFISSNTLFPYEEDFKNTHDLDKDFYYIQFERNPDIQKVITIDNIWMSFDSDVTFNLYLYHSKKLNPIQTKSITVVANEATKIELNYNLDDTGTYRLGYKSSELGTSKPFVRDYSLSAISEDFLFFASDFLDSGRIDINNQEALSDAYGMNIEYSEYYDWTYQIIKNKNLFARGLQLQMAINVCDLIMTTNRSSIIERLSNEELQKMAYVLGSEEGGNGLKGNFAKELNAIKNFFFPIKMIQKATLR